MALLVAAVQMDADRPASGQTPRKRAHLTWWQLLNESELTSAPSSLKPTSSGLSRVHQQPRRPLEGKSRTQVQVLLSSRDSSHSTPRSPIHLLKNSNRVYHLEDTVCMAQGRKCLENFVTHVSSYDVASILQRAFIHIWSLCLILTKSPFP